MKSRTPLHRQRSDSFHGFRRSISRLAFHFTSPVNPSVATEPGKLRMTFSHEPLTAPASSTLTFASKTIPSATYSESNGAAQITVSTNAPLIASFANDGRSITLCRVICDRAFCSGAIPDRCDHAAAGRDSPTKLSCFASVARLRPLAATSRW